MNGLGIFLLGVAVVNPARVRLLLGSRQAGIRSRAAFGGSLAAVGLAAALAALGSPLIDALDVAPETFRIATAMVITLTGLVVIAAPIGTPEKLRGEPVDMAVPVLYPLLAGPGAVLTWLSLGVDEGVWPTAGAAAAAGAVTAILAGLPLGRRSGWAAAARLLATVVVLLGVALVIDGVREV